MQERHFLLLALKCLINRYEDFNEGEIKEAVAYLALPLNSARKNISLLVRIVSSDDYEKIKNMGRSHDASGKL